MVGRYPYNIIYSTVKVSFYCICACQTSIRKTNHALTLLYVVWYHLRCSEHENNILNVGCWQREIEQLWKRPQTRTEANIHISTMHRHAHGVFSPRTPRKSSLYFIPLKPEGLFFLENSILAHILKCLRNSFTSRRFMLFSNLLSESRYTYINEYNIFLILVPTLIVLFVTIIFVFPTISDNSKIYKKNSK